MRVSHQGDLGQGDIGKHLETGGGISDHRDATIPRALESEHLPTVVLQTCHSACWKVGNMLRRLRDDVGMRVMGRGVIPFNAVFLHPPYSPFTRLAPRVSNI